jgi:hypothetical protein
MRISLPEEIQQQIAKLDWEAFMKEPLPEPERLAFCELIDGSMMPVDRFLRDYTDNGSLFHGTPSIENVAGILAKGFRPTSRPDAGTGVYVTKMWETAEIFAFQRAHRGAAIIDLQIQPGLLRMPRDEGGLRVLKWTKDREAELKSLQSADFMFEMADERRMPVWTEICRIFEPDIVVAEGFGIVVTRPEVLALPRSLSAVRESMDLRAERIGSASQRRMADAFSNELFAGLLAPQKHQENPIWQAESQRFVMRVLREIARVQKDT